MVIARLERPRKEALAFPTQTLLSIGTITSLVLGALLALMAIATGRQHNDT